MNEKPYNPLEKLNLARSIETGFLDREPLALDGEIDPIGAGVYALYYSGPFAPYAALAAARPIRPIYVGKAIPKGGRKGGLSLDAASGTSLRDRLRKHANSIRAASNLELTDFSFRYLVVEDIWIPLGENILIETYQPVWNVCLDGFGNNDPGNRRKTQYRSPWDVLHPGRKAAEKLADHPNDANTFGATVAAFLNASSEAISTTEVPPPPDEV